METGITNDIVFFLKRSLPNYIDFLTTNIKITNVVINQNTHEATITTQDQHLLEVDSFVFLNNILYGYVIESITEEEIEVNFLQEKLLKIIFNKAIIANEGEIVDIKGITTNLNLNNKFIVYKCLVDSINEKSIYYGKYVDSTIITAGVNITNQGGVYLPFIDDIFAMGNTRNSTGFSTTTIGGSYNGLKVVKTIINANSFIVKLYQNTSVLQPEYSILVYFNNAYIKKNTQIFGVTSINNEILENATNHLLQNKTQAVLLISKNSSENSAFGTALSNIDVNNDFAFDLLDEQITFDCTLLFRVERKNYNNEYHYILGYESNQITDYFTRIMKSLSNRFFFETNVYLNNQARTNVLYKGYFNGSANINNLNNIENGVFKTCNFSFKITRQESSYNTFNVNGFGIPIKEINLEVEFNNTDNKNINIT